jgi:membrane protease subunit (stomatin/prohibitin family)
MSVFRTVVRTLQENGQDMMAPGVILWRDHNVDIRNRSRLIVESNQKAVVRIQGQVTAVYDGGSYDLNTPNNPVSNFFSRLGYGGNVPWLAEVIFASLARFEARSVGVSQSSELIPLQYQVAYYFQVQDPVKLIQSVQLNGVFYTVNELSLYISPIIDQAVSQVLNNVSIREVYASLHKISEAVTAALKLNLGEIGVNLLMSRVIRIEPEDETLRRVVQLNGLGLDINTAVRARLSELMALRSDPAATNMLLGVPYYPMNIIMGGGGLGQLLPQTQLIPASPTPQAQQAQSKQQQQQPQ